LEIHWKNETFADKRKINSGRKNEMHQKLRAWKRQRNQQLENFDEQKSNLEPTRTLESSETIGIHRKREGT
jgi:hypothetical protein